MEGGSYLHFGIVNFITIGIMVAGWSLLYKGAKGVINKNAGS